MRVNETSPDPPEEREMVADTFIPTDLLQEPPGSWSSSFHRPAPPPQKNFGGHPLFTVAYDKYAVSHAKKPAQMTSISVLTVEENAVIPENQEDSNRL